VFHVEHFLDAQSNTFPLFALAALFVQKRMRRDFNLNKEASENGQRGRDTNGAAYSFLRWSSYEKLFSINECSTWNTLVMLYPIFPTTKDPKDTKERAGKSSAHTCSTWNMNNINNISLLPP
jgi:hypothetical protein